MASLIWAVLVVVVILWLLGFIVGFGGSLIHLLLVVALLLLIYNLFTGRTRVKKGELRSRTPGRPPSRGALV